MSSRILAELFHYFCFTELEVRLRVDHIHRTAAAGPTVSREGMAMPLQGGRDGFVNEMAKQEKMA
jgi:hypothetical protein